MILLQAIAGTAGSWLLFWAIYMLIRYVGWLTNQGNTSYVKSLWADHPELRGKYYWSEGLWDGSQGWSSIVGLQNKTKTEINYALKYSLSVMNNMNTYNQKLVEEYDKIPSFKIRRIK